MTFQEYASKMAKLYKALASKFATITEIEELAQAVDEEIATVVRADYTAYYLYDESSDELRFIYAKGFSKNELREEERLAYERHPGWVVRNKKSLDVNDITKSAVDIKSNSIYPIGSLLFYPLMYDGKCLGTIGFVAERPGYFTHQHRDLLSFVCQLASVAFSNFLLAEKQHSVNHSLAEANLSLRPEAPVSVQTKLRYEKILLNISSRFVGEVDLDEALNSSLADLGLASKSDGASVYVMDEPLQTFVKTHGWQLGVLPSKVNKAERAGMPVKMSPWFDKQLHDHKAIIINSVTDLPPSALFEREHLDDLNIKSMLALPLDIDGTIGGIITLVNYTSERDWEDGIITLLRLSSEIIANALERKRITDMHTSLENQLRQAQKMEAIGRLAGGVAHDINNVLAAIMGSANVLELEMEDDLNIIPDVRNILQACRRGRDLTKNLLGFARKGKYIKEPVCLNEVVLSTIHLLKRTISKKIEIQTYLDPDLLLVEGDRSQLEHALMNVCLNSADAMEEGRGVLSIFTKNMAIAPLDTPKVSIPPGSYVEMRVIDTGEGMDETTLSRAFEPFFTTKPQKKGTGLGLSMVYGTLRNHGGISSIESTINVGTTVTFVLPALQTSIKEPSLPPSRISIMPMGKGLILYVDDEYVVRTSARRVLAALGYTPLVAESGHSALQIYREKGDLINLVILDMIMPHMDGPETFEALRNLDADVPILLCSGYSKDDRVDQLLRNGARGFIQKPFDIRALAKSVAKAVTF